MYRVFLDDIRQPAESTGPDMSIDALMSVIPYFRIAHDRARDILAKVEHAVAGWHKAAHVIGMTDEELASFADAFEHSERNVVRKLL